MEHKHIFGPWKKLIFTKIRWCKVLGCYFSQRKDLEFTDGGGKP